MSLIARLGPNNIERRFADGDFSRLSVPLFGGLQKTGTQR
jgi:hypothetical protein